jgi:hypothetical protein
LPDVARSILDSGYAPREDQSFRIIPIPQSIDAEQKLLIHRLNGFGSLYYFIKIVLGRSRLTSSFHLPLCRQMEATHLKDLWEIPRDHFKSTICGEGLPMWWALPFMPYDADSLRLLGYKNEFIAFMTLVHDSCTRTVLISENITNAAKLGSKIRWHFESNAAYRAIYPESLPTTRETWTSFSLQARRIGSGSDAAHGEGTFDFLGVGSALQSRHYPRMIKDDLVGRKAIESISIMEKTIEYHKLSVGAFESMGAEHLNDEVVVGNRWDYHDLNSYIRENEPWFRIHSHSALGGCCPEHPENQPIFPEEFSAKKLEHRRRTLGAYLYSCQFLNNPCAPEDADFQPAWLRYYDFKRLEDGNRRIEHEVHDSMVRKDVDINHLAKVEITDPAHSGNASANRCRHAVIIVGVSDDNNYYLLDCWARSGSYDTYFDAIYKLADAWKIYRLGVETVAAQRYVAYHINYRNLQSGRRLKIIELKGEVEGPDGSITRKKEYRIRNVLGPIFEQGRFWVRRDQADFLGEFTTFPKGKFCDILDALAYSPQVLKGASHAKDMPRWARQNAERLAQLNQPYSVMVN